LRTAASQGPADDLPPAGDQDLESGLRERRSLRLRDGGNREGLPTGREIVEALRVLWDPHEGRRTPRRNLPFDGSWRRAHGDRASTSPRDAIGREAGPTRPSQAKAHNEVETSKPAA